MCKVWKLTLASVVLLLLVNHGVAAGENPLPDALTKLVQNIETKRQSSQKKEAVTLAEADKPVVLTIDGFSLSATAGQSEGQIQSYLQEGFNASSWPFVSRWENVVWSGQIRDTEDTVEDTKNYVRSLSMLALSEGRPFVIVAHSWGSVLAYRSEVVVFSFREMDNRETRERTEPRLGYAPHSRHLFA